MTSLLVAGIGELTTNAARPLYSAKGLEPAF